MNILIGARRSGKTWKLLHLAHKRGGVIICTTHDRAKDLKHQSLDMGLDVETMSVSRLRNDGMRGRPVHEIYLDDAELILANLIRQPVRLHTITMTVDAMDNQGVKTLVTPKRRVRKKQRSKNQDRKVEI
jgi:hypothetical protein